MEPQRISLSEMQDLPEPKTSADHGNTTDVATPLSVEEETYMDAVGKMGFVLEDNGGVEAALDALETPSIG